MPGDVVQTKSIIIGIQQKSKEDYLVSYLGKASWRKMVLELDLEGSVYERMVMI